MLVEFSVGNYLSFKDTVTFSMVAADIHQHDKTHKFEWKNLSLLKSACIYGANASGKSNFVKAYKFAIDFINNSSKESQVGEEIKITPFLLSTETENKPSLFEFVFIINDFKYRYGFEITKERVVSEWLFRTKKEKEYELFIRDFDNININNKLFDEGAGIEAKTRQNALFLSVVANFNGNISKLIIDSWLMPCITEIENIYTDWITNFCRKCPKIKEEFKKILTVTDFGIEDFIIEKTNKELSQELIKFKGIFFEDKIKVYKQKYDQNNQPLEKILFDLEDQESRGTQKIFSIAGPILSSLTLGHILIIDEFETMLHPLLAQFLVKLFNSNEHNPNNAQLIFTTHETNFLTNKLFRRDQIWFCEKNKYGATDLYSLNEYDVRHDASFEKDYLKGKYGAIPIIKDLDFFHEEESEEVCD
jgi:AAA15 family ATPase/GTPase